MIFVFYFYLSLIAYLRTVKLQSFIFSFLTLIVSFQLMFRIIPFLFSKSPSQIFKVKETLIDYEDLLDLYPGSNYMLVQNYNESIIHNFELKISESKSILTISSSIISNDKNNTKNMQITAVRIKLGNLTNTEISLNTLFISNFLNTTNSNLEELNEL